LKVGGEYIPGRGDEDIAANSHANLHSAAIMQNYYTPEICVGPTEPNGNVYVMDSYNWERYNVAASPPIYWDDNFTVKLNSKCNTSYASMPLAKERKQREWRDSYNTKFDFLGNRGIDNGHYLDEQHITYEIHGGRKQWVGNVVYGDNHVDVHKSFLPQGAEYQQGGENFPDNLFKNDTGGSDESADGFDMWLCLVSKINSSEVLTLTWD
ncbi:MAG: hypothetical protein KJO43_11040, partial [Phycisphaerae bacterium]|nr:hypothetical protein [Phycisphaerae bacterium]